MDKRYSILNNLDKCFVCGKPKECIHEVFLERTDKLALTTDFVLAYVIITTI